jgi:hypothetical protein
MENSIIIQGKEYTLAKYAGKHFGYTKEYILMLIKQGKIDGKKVGNKWFVSVPSIESYFTHARTKREERLHKLSENRKAELKIHEKKFAHISQAQTIQEHSSSPSPYTSHVRIALLETAVILFLGISIGSLGYVGYTTPASVQHSQVDFLKTLAVSVYDFFTIDTFVSRIGIQQARVSEITIYDDTHNNDNQNVQEKITTRPSLVIAPQDMSIMNSDSIKESFSDTVDVIEDSTHPNTGIIIPKFSKGNGEEYRYMIVPVNTTTR